MRNLWLVTRREYLSRIKSGAYISSTIILMLVFFGTTFLPALIDSSSRSDPIEVTVLDKTGQVFPLLQLQVQQEALATQAEREVRLTQSQEDESTLIDQARDGHSAVLIIEGEFPGGLKARYLASSLALLQDSGLVFVPLENAIRSVRLQQRGLPPDVAVEIMQPLEIEAMQIAAGEDERSAEQFAGTIFLAIGAIMSVCVITVMNSQFVFQGVLEEKVSRVVEVMAGAVRPWEMMAGKILGLGGLGLTQYILMMASWLAGNYLSQEVVEVPTQSISLRIAGLIIIFTLLSYLLNASLMAALGATVSRMEDGQTVSDPVIMLMVLPMLLLTPVMSDPNGTTAVVLSFIPFFTPIIMLLRVIVGDVPAWQVGLSIGILVATTAVVTWLSGRIYRAALLTFGSRPTMKQFWQYLRTG